MHRFLIVVVIWSTAASAADVATALTPQQFESLRQRIRPQVDECGWATVPWLVNLKEARQRAVQEDRPLFLWRSGGGDVLGRT